MAAHGSLSGLRLAGRALRRAPVFTAAAVLTLGLGVGVNAAVFSAVHGILLRPFALPQAERLVSVGQDMTARGGRRHDLTGWAVFAAWRERQRSFSGLAAYLPSSADLSAAEPPENVAGGLVSHELFRVLGVQPARGRGFLAAEEVAGQDGVAVLSDGLWRRRFGADPAVVGRTVVVNGRPRTVVGVLPRGFRSPVLPEAEIWLPQALRLSKDWGHAYVGVVGRLRAGVPLAAARAEMRRLQAALAAERPADLAGIGAAVEPLTDTVAGEARRPLLGLQGAALLVLAVSCFNLATLCVARAVARRPELALRLALGGGRTQLARLFAVESVWIAGGAAALGVGLGAVCVALLRGLAPPGTPRLDEVRLDGAAAAVTLLAAFAASFAAGAVPALWTLRRGGFAALRAGAATGAGRPGLRLRGVLVAAQIAVSVLLLWGAGALLRSLRLLDQVDPGFRSTGVVIGRLKVMPAHFPQLGDVRDFMARYEERLAARPEIAAAGLVSGQPLADGSELFGFALDGQDAAAEKLQGARLRAASPGYFAAAGVPLRAGRVFTPADGAAAPPVAVVNDSFARQFLGGRSPLGHRVRSRSVEGDGAPWRLITGVVGDVRGSSLAEAPQAELYLPLQQVIDIEFTVVARAARTPGAALAALRQVAGEVRRGQILVRPETMTAALERGLAPRRFTAVLVASFAAAALLLAAIGVYGVTALVVAERRGELAVRMALGARPSEVGGVVVRWSAALAGCGVAAGLAAAVALRQALAGFLYGVEPLDAVVLGGAVGLLAVAALVATLVPAAAAMRMNAADALRRGA